MMITPAHRHDGRPCSGLAPVVLTGAIRAAAREKRAADRGPGEGPELIPRPSVTARDPDGRAVRDTVRPPVARRGSGARAVEEIVGGVRHSRHLAREVAGNSGGI